MNDIELRPTNSFSSQSGVEFGGEWEPALPGNQAANGDLMSTTLAISVYRGLDALRLARIIKPNQATEIGTLD